MDRISHIIEIKILGAQNLTSEFSQISVEPVTVNISYFLDVYICFLFHQFIISCMAVMMSVMKLYNRKVL